MEEKVPIYSDPAHTLQGPHGTVNEWDTPNGFKPLHLELLDTGQRLELTRAEVVLGRHTEADVRRGYPEVSRRHCRLSFQAGKWRIFDLNSLNGLYVNGERIHETVLYEGDQVSLGTVTFLVCCETGMLSQDKGGVLQSIADVLPMRKQM